VDCSVEEANSGAVIFVAEVHGIKQVSRAASLLDPVVATIGRLKNYAIIADDGADIGVHKMHSKEVNTIKWVA
jgi:hypothetical protein